MMDPVPATLLSDLSPFLAPVLSIRYSGDTSSITILGTVLTLVDGVDDLEIEMGGKTSSQVAGEITKGNLAYQARVLFEIPDMGQVTLTTSTSDLTTDGAQIVRAAGHIFRHTEQSRLRLLPPHNEERHLPWFIRVDRGQVRKDLNGATWLFALPEYENQAWSTKYGRPYKDHVDAKAVRAGPNAIVVPRTPLLWRNNNITLTVSDVVQPSTVIRDVDEANGVIYLNATYDENETVLVDYAYEERAYVYQGIDLNPTEFHNPAILDRFVVFYLLPYSGPQGIIRNTTVFHAEGATLFGAVMAIPRTEEPFILLGAAQVRQVGDVLDTDVIDTRVRGGGIKRSKFEDAIKRTQEAYSTTDYGRYNGLSYGGSAVVVELKRELTDLFESDALDRVLKKHLAFGVPYILEKVS